MLACDDFIPIPWSVVLYHGGLRRSPKRSRSYETVGSGYLFTLIGIASGNRIVVRDSRLVSESVRQQKICRIVIQRYYAQPVKVIEPEYLGRLAYLEPLIGSEDSFYSCVLCRETSGGHR